MRELSHWVQTFQMFCRRRLVGPLPATSTSTSSVWEQPHHWDLTFQMCSRGRLVGPLPSSSTYTVEEVEGCSNAVRVSFHFGGLG